MTGTDPRKVKLQPVFAARLRRLRRAYAASLGRAKLSVPEMARMMGVEAERWRTWETGSREPPLFVLTEIRRLTGASLDGLLTGRSTVDPTMLSFADLAAMPEGAGLSDRLRWVREIKEPDVEVAADVMAVALDVWVRWEWGIEQPPLPKLNEFAGRFSVSLDFLYAGRWEGVQPALKEALLERHSALRAAPARPPPLPDRRTASGGRNNPPPERPPHPGWEVDRVDA